MIKVLSIIMNLIKLLVLVGRRIVIILRWRILIREIEIVFLMIVIRQSSDLKDLLVEQWY